MTITDDAGATHAPAQGPPQTVLQQLAGQQPGEQDARPVRRTTVRRRPAARGTLALGALSAGGIAVTSAAVMLPPVAAAAVAGAAVIIPTSVLIRRARRGARRRRGATAGRTNPFGATSGGRGRGLFGGRGGGSGFKFPKLGGSTGRTGRAGGSGLPKGGAKTPGGGAAFKTPGLPKTGKTPTGRTGRLGSIPKGRGGTAGLGLPSLTDLTGRKNSSGRGSRTPRASTVGRSRLGSGGPRSVGRLGLGSPFASRHPKLARAGRVATAPVRGVRNVARRVDLAGAKRDLRATGADLKRFGRQVKAGYRAGKHGGAGRAARVAFRAAGYGRPRSFAGRVGKLLAGSLAACGALAGHATARGAKAAVRSVKDAYAPKTAAAATPENIPTAPSGDPTQVPEHPVPKPVHRDQPTVQPVAPSTPAPAGAAPGGAPMTVFPPRDAAVDFYATATKYTPGTHSGSLWNFQEALPSMVESACLVANGWRAMVARIDQDLQGGIKPEMMAVLTDVFRLYAKAAELAASLPSTFAKIHAEDIDRASRRGSHTANVPVSGRN